MEMRYFDPKQDHITPERLFYSRRKFLRLAAMFGTAYALAACGIRGEEIAPTETAGPIPTMATSAAPEVRPYTAEDRITSFTNFYEFSVDKFEPAELAQSLQTSPWPIEVSGLVEKPATVDAADLIKTYGGEERVYRLRCVEGWSMVVPWYGFPLKNLLADLKPQADARYVKFTTLYDPEQMPGQNRYYYFTWPYTEGLRLDEARNDLALLAWGLYGKELAKQNGAPLRLVVPWKYGCKSIKSIVKIELTAEQPPTFWNTSAPGEYGFYANVNPNVDHPRWSQASEYRVGEEGSRPTLMFNGYENEVGYLYEGMDLEKDY
jgi:sulfoxide reductase catalytic subunit YedY